MIALKLNFTDAVTFYIPLNNPVNFREIDNFKGKVLANGYLN